MSTADRIRGFLWGGAVGDALGARAKNRAAPESALLHITALTQATLFVAESLPRSFAGAAEKGVWPNFAMFADRALERWLATQGYDAPFRSRWGFEPGEFDGWLISSPQLWERVEQNGNTIDALRAPTAGSPEQPPNARRGSSMLCLATVAGIAGRPVDDDGCRILGERFAALTHGHPEALAVAGAGAVLVRAVVHEGDDWPEARRRAAAVVGEHVDVRAALAVIEPDDDDGLPAGDGSTGASALAIALGSVSRATTFDEVIANALNRGGAVRTTCQLAGALAGARHGVGFVPEVARAALAERAIVDALADDLARYMSLGADEWPGDPWLEHRYPGHP